MHRNLIDLYEQGILSTEELIAKINEKKEALDFGSYVRIEQHRYGVPNEMYLYKVINRMGSGSWVDVPVMRGGEETPHDHMATVLSCICCGVDETKVQKFRIDDVHLVE